MVSCLRFRSHPSHLFLLIPAAEFVQERSFGLDRQCVGEANKRQQTIVNYLRTEYVPLLQRAGCHFIHSLPDFDCLPHSRPVDWSMHTEFKVETLHVFNISVEFINNLLKSRWLQHAHCADEIDDHDDHPMFGDYALARHRGIREGFRFDGHFGPPQVQALCSREALFTINIDYLEVVMGGQHKEFV